MNYLNKMTVKELREIATRMECKIPGMPLSKARKADLIMVIEAVMEYDHLVALEMDILFDSPNAVQKDGVWYNRGWNCCSERPAKVVVFDEGTKWAVCKSCASMYTGEVQDIPGTVEPETYTIEIEGRDSVVITDPSSVAILKNHEKAVRRFNPTMKRRKNGQVILTDKQRRRVQKHTYKLAKKLGLYEVAA